MSFYIKLLIILAACSISNVFVSSVYSVQSTQSQSSMFGQRCFEDSCSTIACFNDNPCQTVTNPNPSRSSSSDGGSDDNGEEEDDNSGFFFDNFLPW